MVARLEECESRLTEETKERQSGEKEVATPEAESAPGQAASDDTQWSAARPWGPGNVRTLKAQDVSAPASAHLRDPAP